MSTTARYPEPRNGALNAKVAAANAGVALPAEDLFTRVSHSVARVSSVGLAASLLLHVLLTTAAIFIGIGGGFGGGRAGEGSGNTTIEFNLTAPAELVDVPAGLIDDHVLVAGADVVPEVGTPGIMDGAGGFDEPATGDGLGQIAEGLGGAGGGDVGSGEGLGGGAMGGGASFFGVEAQGSRFVYICDISGSMNERAGPEVGTRLSVLKNELTKSIRGLVEHMQFCVLLFSSQASPLMGDARWAGASDSAKRASSDRIGDIQGFGGTEPWPAFEIAFAMRPQPDAIYFMTDGVFDPAVAFRVAQRNVGSRKIPIHCITLVEKSGEEVMRKIAAESGGTYTHVPGGLSGGGSP